MTSVSRTWGLGGQRIVVALVLAFWLTVLQGADPAYPDDEGTPFKLAISSDMFANVNDNDVRAAMKVWIMTIAKERGIPVDPEPYLFKTVEELMQSGKNDGVHGVGIVLTEFETLNRFHNYDRFAAAVIGGSITEEYVLLVRANSSVHRIEHLRGKSLNVALSPRMNLATIWLDLVLAEAGLPRVNTFFGRVSEDKKTERVALPVFFGQTDACLMTRAGFQVMGELNPQIREQLREVVSSPPVIPSGFAFRAGSENLARDKMVDAIMRLGETSAGRQILTLTQADRIQEEPISCLDASLALLARHRRRFGETNPSFGLTAPGHGKSGGQ
jgi:ABC-type phosphate/phosphonate transport system substrate-binding protein